MSMDSTSTLIGGRYRLLNQLGAGGMGAVYQALDLLTGQAVALKMVLAPTQQLQFASRSDGFDLHLALAQEFQALASLRHPYIIGVRDYGFTPDRQPYFSMDLLENARTIMEAGAGQPPTAQVNLLVQMLQALAYLHRRGIVHRDLKPSNVLVIKDEAAAATVKVVDFGLAMAVEHDGSTSGTLAYMAPEVLDGQPAGVTADLYAVGVIAFELLAGRHPFDTASLTKLMMEIMNTVPDVKAAGLDPTLGLIVERLLAKEPRERYQEAQEVIEALSQAINQALPPETEATRESFLQAAPLVGREAELAQLKSWLGQAMAGQGAVWFIGGESGVGKSRLLDEFRAIALVRGAVVLRGQELSAGSSPYQPWRTPLRRLSLRSELSELEASVLKPLIPDLALLLNRAVMDAPELDPQAAQPRLLAVIEAILKRQTQPLVFILEDLHWSGNETLAVLSHLSRLVTTWPILILGSYRSDERPELPRQLPQVQVLTLSRLSPESIAHLSEAMLGQAGRQPHIINLLERETEGNVFFLIEVVRALAEEAGRLDQIGRMTLPAHIFAGGVRQIVQRRLEQVPSWARPLLQLAAVAGRQLDLPLLQAIEPTLDLEAWLAVCTNAAVLDLHDERWRFAHDKLRDSLLADLAETERRTLHQQIAEALEATSQNLVAQATVLAHHWAQAGNPAKEGHYAALAGGQALASGAYQEAVTLLSRALALFTPAGDAAAPDQISPQILLHRQLGEAHLGSGNMPAARRQLAEALLQLGYPPPATPWALWVGLVGQILQQAAHRVWPGYFFNQARYKAPLREAAHIGILLGLIYYLGQEVLSLLHVGFRTVNLGEKAGPSPELARGYANLGVIAGLIPLHPLARLYNRRALATAHQVDQPLSLAWVLTVTGVYQAGVGQWEQAEAALKRSMELCEQVGDQRRWEESAAQLGMTFSLQGRFEESAALYGHVYQSAQRRGDPQLQAWSLNGQARNLLPLNRLDEALALLLQAEQLLAKEVGPLSRINVYGTLALAHLRQGNVDSARHAADTAAKLIATSPQTSYYVLQGYAAVAEVYLSLWEKGLEDGGWRMEDAAPNGSSTSDVEPGVLAQRACRALNRFGRVFPIGQPRARLYQGQFEWLSGRPAKARALWQKGLTAAQQQHMPYEQTLIQQAITKSMNNEQ
jgi:tetratricopeptide (TPR) repeat protein